MARFSDDTYIPTEEFICNYPEIKSDKPRKLSEDKYLKVAHLAMFATKLNDQWLNIHLSILTPESLNRGDSQTLRKYLEIEGMKILVKIMTPEMMKKQWDMEDFD
jgi:hypothetical protein